MYFGAFIDSSHYKSLKQDIQLHFSAGRRFKYLMRYNPSVVCTTAGWTNLQEKAQQPTTTAEDNSILSRRDPKMYS